MKEDKNGSDKNVGRIENDMKILEEMVEKSRDLREEDFYKLIGIKQMQAISSFIKRYKELKEENRYLKTHIIYPEIIKLNYIPISLLEEKIEELKSKSGGNVFHIQQTINAEIRLLQELLEKRK